jgi:hypothetical protein
MSELPEQGDTTMLVTYGDGPIEREVTGPAALDDLLNQVQEQARAEDRPVLVTVNATEDRFLSLGVTADGAAHVVAFDDMDTGESLLSGGAGDTGEETAFYYGNQYSFYPADSLVDSARALAAVREFFRTGQPPTGIEWR